MNTPVRRFRFLFVPAVAILALLSLACGMKQTRVPACENETSSDLCNACCTREGHTGHAYNSNDTPPCECVSF